ncbi:MAG: dephospho-CoA kinase [Brevundimonas sp.]|uniref:dephospho-CoA kinase n=1 Tax=Brevundimonas sp. TaxID=1871086 RepID=UPI00391BD08C
MIRIGLTGSIGMGKSTTAAMFREMGIAVWCADEAVHRFYDQGGAGVAIIGALHGEAVRDGRVDRARLSQWLGEAPERFALLEAAIHPLVEADRQAFLDRAEAQGADMVVLDIPLLLEKGLEVMVDRVVVVSAPEHIQRERVLARPGMSAERLDLILSRQMPDDQKRAKADFVIETHRGMDHARRQVRAIVESLRS